MSPRDPAVRNTIAYALPEVLWGFAWALAIDHPMPAAFADGFGASEQFLGTFGLVTAIGLGIPMIFTGYLLAPWARKRGLLFWGHLAPAIVLGLLAIAVSHADDLSARLIEVLYIGSFFVFFFSIGVLVPVWLSLLGDLFPDRHRTRVLGITFTMNRLGGLVGGRVAKSILASADSAGEQWGLIFGIASVAMLAGSLPFLWIIEEPRKPSPRPPIRTYLGDVKRMFLELRELRRFIGVDMLGVTAVVVILFYGDAAMRGHGIDVEWAGSFVMVSAGVQLALGLTISVLGHRVAPRNWLVVGALVMALGAFVAAAASSPWAFAVVAGAAGAWMMIRMTCHAPQVLRLAPGRDGTTPIALAWTASVWVQGLAPFAAGALIPLVGYAWVFVPVGCLVLVCALLLLTRISGQIGNPDTSCNIK